MRLKEQARDSEDSSEQREISNDIQVDCVRSLRWVKLADTIERSLYWLIPAATLAYLVFRILLLLGS
jgi:hypothetical protein